MVNQFVIVGRVEELPDMEDKFGIIRLKVKRTFANEDGEYLEDIIKVVVNNNLLSNMKDYVKIGDLIGIKGRIESNAYENTLLAEKITFLSK